MVDYILASKNTTLYIIDHKLSIDYYVGLSSSLEKVAIQHYLSIHDLMVEKNTNGLLLIDADIDDIDLINFISKFSRTNPNTKIIVMVNSQQSHMASEALRAGAIDYLLKPFTAAQLKQVILDTQQLSIPQENLIATSVVSQKVLQLARRAAHSDATVLITGESGTGKECLANFIHLHSPRSGGPFVAVNCAAIPENMLEALLFGVNKGAYTGAIKSQPGKFELANGGTLLLDEIAEMPLALQAKLLRVLQEREVERLGCHIRIPLNIRIIASTNQDLRQMVSEGTFRQDLFYRLDVLPLSWPSLRERPDDILPLATHFLKKYAQEEHYKLSSQTQNYLKTYSWPGNVRELENVIQRALIMAKGLYLQPADLMLTEHQAEQDAYRRIEHEGAVSHTPPPLFDPTGAETLSDSKRQAEYQYVLEVLQRCDGHRTQTAKILGMTTRALRYKLAAMRENGIDIDIPAHP